jgi:hypothetical protein
MDATQTQTELLTLVGLGPDTEPLARLRTLTAYKQALDALTAKTVAAARADDRSWPQIGQALGVSKQAVAERYGKATSEAGPVSVEDAIRAAYARLVTADNEWVGLAPLRTQLTAYTRDEVDAGLRALAKVKGVHIIPVANFKSLIQEDHDAALLLGGYHSHAIAIERQ